MSQFLQSLQQYYHSHFHTKKKLSVHPPSYIQCLRLEWNEFALLSQKKLLSFYIIFLLLYISSLFFLNKKEIYHESEEM